jgi:hypothetical protein
MENVIKCKKCDNDAILENKSVQYIMGKEVSKTKRLHCSKCRISWSHVEDLNVKNSKW